MSSESAGKGVVARLKKRKKFEAIRDFGRRGLNVDVDAGF